MRKILLVTAALLLTACGGSSADDPGLVLDHAFTTGEIQVDGAARPLAAGSTLTLTFTADSVSANAGCNTMSAPVSLDDGTLTLTAPLASTRMACPPELMAQDEWLAGFLVAAPTWSMSSTDLVLTGATGTLVLQSTGS